MSRAAKLTSLGVVCTTTLAWAVERDAHVAIEQLAPSDATRIVEVEVTADGYALPDRIQWSADFPEVALAYVDMYVGPIALVLEQGEEGFFVVGWFPRIESGNPCAADIELFGDEVQVVAYRSKANGRCEPSAVNTFRVHAFQLDASPAAPLSPTVLDTFTPMSAHDVGPHRWPLFSPL